MISSLRELFSLFSNSQRRELFALQFLMVMMALFELFGIASVGPFMALVADPSLLGKYVFGLPLSDWLPGSGKFDDLVILGFAVLIFLGIGSLVSMFTTWRISHASFRIGSEISERLYRHYLRKNWQFHASTDSAHLTKQVATESFRLTAQVILPALHMNARLILALFVILGLFVFDPRSALVITCVYLTAYFLLFRVVRKALAKNGELISRVSRDRIHLLTESFQGIRDVILLNIRQGYQKKFGAYSSQWASAYGANNALAYAPRYLIEFVAYGAMIGLILFLLIQRNAQLSTILPVLSIYALAGFKLLPALQVIYAGISEIRGNIAAFYSLRRDLIESSSQLPLQSVSGSVQFDREIVFHQVTLKYCDREHSALSAVELVLKKGKFIGLVGPSGSGKSSVIDLLSGLLRPTSGTISIDDSVLTDDLLGAWQKKIAVVSQGLFLVDGTIGDNIRLGSDPQLEWQSKLEESLKSSGLADFVAQLPQGINTPIGDRGVALSGGQKQRLSLARALFLDREVLILDEATSALDVATESEIMKNVVSLRSQKTIISIAHRVNTLRECDTIFLLKDGRVEDTGTFESLLARSKEFRDLVAL